MTRTVPREELPLDTQRILEDLLAPGASVILSRDGEPFGAMASYDTSMQNFEPETSEEIEEIQEAVRQGRADRAAGRYTTLDEIKARYADRLREPNV